MNAYEVAGFVFGVLAVWLTAKESPWCWPTGLVNVALYIVVFWQAKLYADMGLQVVYVAVCLYGWWEWLHGGPGGGKLSVSRVPRAHLLAISIAGALAAGVLGVFLRTRTDAALPFWDATTTSYSLVAQWLQTRKWIETWWFWIGVDVIYIGVYMVKHLWLTALLYAIFLALCILGLKEWRRSLEKAATAEVKPPAAHV